MKSLQNRKALILSIFISIFLHALQIHFFQHQSLWLSDHSSKKSNSIGTLSFEKQEKKEILKQTFSFSSSKEKTSSHLVKQESLQSPLKRQLIDLHPEPLNSSMPRLSFNFENPELLSQKFSLLSKWEPKDFAFPPLPSLLPTISSSIPVPSSPAVPIPASLEKTSIKELKPNSIDLSFSIKEPAFVPEEKTPSKIELNSHHDLSLKAPQSISYSHKFETDLLFVEEQEGEYLFAVTLIPQNDLSFLPLKSTYYFLIDKSNSIQKERLQATKSAIRKAIDELKEGDEFNIIAFDSKVEKLFSFPLKPSLENRSKAQIFLNNLELGSFFSKSDLYKPLFLTLPSTDNKDEIHIALLFSDGESLQNQDLLKTWSIQNQGRVALYSINLNTDPQGVNLATLSNLNKGKAVLSPTHRGLKRKLLKLMKSLQLPIAKNLSFHAISTSSQGSIELFPTQELAPYLFQSEPFTIIGKTNTLDDLFLFIQGRLNGEWMHIKKRLNFASAKKAHASLKTEWALQKAYTLYDNYLCENNLDSLEEAKEIAQMNDLQLSFYTKQDK